MAAKKVYGLYKLVDKGTAEELANKYFVQPNTIKDRVHDGNLLLGEYKVFTLPEKKLKIYTVSENDKIIATGTALELADFLGVTQSTVYAYVSSGKKLSGKYMFDDKEVENNAD